MNAPAQHAESMALANVDHSAGAQLPSNLMLNPQLMNQMMVVAEAMANATITVPQHFRGKPGDCLAVVMQATQWNMNPFAVAQKTHVVNGQLGYEAQLVHAVLQGTGAIEGTFEYEYRNETTALECRVAAICRGDKKLTWGEWLSIAQVTTKNSPLWKTNPKQQMGYLQVKNWARAFKPGAILGVYTADELADPAPEKFMGPAEVVPPTGPVYYAAADFDKNLPAWTKYVQSKKKTPDEIIATVEVKAPLTDDQKARIHALAPQKPAATDVEPKVTFAQVADLIAKAGSRQALDEAADLIGEVADEQQRLELRGQFDQRTPDFN